MHEKRKAYREVIREIRRAAQWNVQTGAECLTGVSGAA